MLTPTPTTARARQFAARAALHVFAADLGMLLHEADITELLGGLLGGLLAGLRDEAVEAAGGSPQLWLDAIASMARISEGEL